jgi:hypothetical protein
MGSNKMSNIYTPGSMYNLKIQTLQADVNEMYIAKYWAVKRKKII